MNSPITAELLRKCQERGECSTVTMACQALGAAVDAGLIELADLLAEVRACSTPAQLADLLQRLAVTTNGMSEDTLEVPTWTR